MADAPVKDEAAGHGSLTNAATSGSIWMLLQTVLHKVLALGAMWLLARLLDPSDFGLASYATSIGAFVFVLSPYSLCEVLVTMKSTFHRVAGAAFLVGAIAAALLCIGLTSASGLMERITERPGLAFLLCFVAWRPIADAIQFIPLARIRMDLRYREQARIDAAVIFGATIASVALAYFGAGALALVLPPIISLALRGVLFTWVTGWTSLRVDPSMIRPMARTFSIAALGQYFVSLIGVLDILVVGWCASNAGVGLFAFAFMLATQANSVLAAQVALVLQPIFVRITDDAARQVAAFMRATRMLSAVCIPISIMQATLAPAGFALFFEPKWAGCVPIIIALSIGQAFLFAVMPASALMKAQGRFTVFCIWQFTQLVGSISAYALAVNYGQGIAANMIEYSGLTMDEQSVTPFAIAVASAVAWALFLPPAVWLAGRPGELGKRAVARLFLAPWIVCIPLAAAVLYASHLMSMFCSATVTHVLTLACVGPIALLVAIIGCAREHPDTWADFLQFMKRVQRKQTPTA